MEDHEPGADWNLTYGQEKDLLRLLDLHGDDEGAVIGTPGDCENRLWHLFGGPSLLNEWLYEVQNADEEAAVVQRLAEFDAVLRRGAYDGPPVPVEEFREFLFEIRANGVYGWRTDYGGSEE